MTSQSRRKHSACLFRMRENCPFRKLRRNVHDESRLVPTGGQWRTETPPQAGASGSDCGIHRAVSVDTFSGPPQSDSHLHEEFSAMDTDMDSSNASDFAIADAPGPSNLSLVSQQHRPSSSDTVMDLDSRVDPETGERAQG